MKDSLDLSTLSPGLSESSSLKHVCSNEVTIRNQPYIISMCVYNSKQPQMDLEVEAKESADQWKASFDITAIETMTAKTGNFKSFSVFVNMLENAINQESTSVNIDLFTYDDLEALRKKRQGQSGSINHHHQQPTPANIQLANKRYLILTYNAEYDRIYYPLSLPYCGKPDPVVLMQQVRQLTAENRLLKSRLESDVERSDIIRLQRECARLKKENNEIRQQSNSNRSNDQQQQQIELLHQMVRASEDALNKERAKITTIKKTDDYRVLNDQVESLKTSERQLKSKVRSLTNEIALLKRSTLHHPTTIRSSSRERSLQLNGYSPRSLQQRPPSLSRPSSGEQRRHRSDHLLPTASSRNRSKHRSNSNDSRRSGSETRHRSSSITKRSPSPADSRGRFNPTAYIRERNVKLRQIEIQKSREARRRRSAGRRGSDSDMSDFSARGGSKTGSVASLRLNDSDDGIRTSTSRRSSSRKRSGGFNQFKSKDLTDSDIEGAASPPVLRKAGSTNITSHKSHYQPSSDPEQQNQNPLKSDSTNTNDMIDIDERLKSLEKFMKENLPS